MPGTVFGADADQLDQLAETMKAVAADLESERQRLNATFYSIQWEGAVAEAFEGTWNSQCDFRMRESANFLADTAEDLIRQATEQREASQGGAGPGRFPLPYFEHTGDGSEPPLVTGDDTRATYLPYGEPDYHLYGESGQPSINDIVQGDLGDCWFLASIASDTLLDPAELESRIVANSDGTYTVTLYQPTGHWFWRDWEEVQVTVDGDFPSVNQGNTIYAHPNDNVLWPLVMEKAIAKLEGGYEEIDGGWGEYALEALHGSGYHSVSSGDDRFLEVALQPGSVLSSSHASNPVRQDELNVANFHEYCVESVDVENGLVTIYNPWGPDARITITFEDVEQVFGTTFEPD